MKRAIKSLLPVDPVPTAEWTQKELRLPSENSDTSGLYNLKYCPYIFGIFAALDDPQVIQVTCMKAAQIAWTTSLIGWMGAKIDTAPGPMIVMFSADGAARDFSLEKLKPIVQATPALGRLIDVSGSTRSGNTVLYKTFPGGFLKLISSNSVRSVKSTPAKYVVVEEPDDANENVGSQGDSITLLWERTKRMRNAKRALGGTPSVKNFSRVEEHTKNSDKRVLPIVCHDCGDSHVLDFEYVVGWEAPEDAKGAGHEIYGHNNPDLAVYCCPHCGSIWDDYQRKENIRSTVYNAIEAGDPMCGWVATAEFTGNAGFIELSELYSCLNGAGLSDLVKDYLEAEYHAAQGDENKKIVFINSKLARPYEFSDGRSDSESFKERAAVDPGSQHDELICPNDGLMITIGIDVQRDRVAVGIRAWGRGEESWLMYWGELYAVTDTIDKTDPVWEELDKLVFQCFQHESGCGIYASAISIDSSDGNTSDAVYHWVRTRSKSYPGVLVMAIKGSSQNTNPEIFVQPKAKSIDHKNPKKATKADKRGVKVYIVGTEKAKDWIANHMDLDGEGPGRFHYYNADQMRWDYFNQMTAEAKIPSKRLRNKKVWTQKPGAPCEAWDCEVYALHAARAKRIHLIKPSEWDALERTVKQADMFQPQVLAAAQEEKDQAPQRRKSNYW